MGKQNSIVKDDLPQNLLEFNLEEDAFRFATIGIFNTPRDNSFYKIVALVGDRSFTFSNPDWRATNATTYRFEEDKDVSLEAGPLQLEKNQCIVYEIHCWNPERNVVEYVGFSLQPLVTQMRGETYLVCGQQQLPVYHGKVPEQI